MCINYHPEIDPRDEYIKRLKLFMHIQQVWMFFSIAFIIYLTFHN